MRPVVVVLLDEAVESRLLLQDIRRCWFGRFPLQRPVHALVPAVLLRMAWGDALDPNPEAEPPHR
jgi:hypothetical protein